MINSDTMNVRGIYDHEVEADTVTRIQNCFVLYIVYVLKLLDISVHLCVYD